MSCICHSMPFPQMAVVNLIEFKLSTGTGQSHMHGWNKSLRGTWWVRLRMVSGPRLTRTQRSVEAVGAAFRNLSNVNADLGPSSRIAVPLME